jgi:predicted MPP superfamily phosphohydrolase
MGPLYPWFVEPRWVQGTYHRVAVKGLPQTLNVVHLTDIHASRAVPLRFVRRVFERINAERPDLIVVTGDLVTEDTSYIDGIAALLGELRARLGTYVILGNHDYWTDGGRISRALETHGVVHLRNTNVLLDGLRLVGIDDHWTGNDNLDRAMAGVGDDEPRLLLMHSPDLIYQAADGNLPLALCGHTHGGQVRIPGYGAITVPSAYGFEQGWYDVEGSRMYVNRGLGTLPIRARFNCRPEVLHLELVPE